MYIGICDDNSEARKLIADRTLEFLKSTKSDDLKTQTQIKITEYESGQQVLDLAASGSIPDILFLDIQMPKPDGMETAGRLRQIDKNLIIIFVTAIEEYVFQAFDVGAFHYIVKPFDGAKFEMVLQKAIEQLEERNLKSDKTKEEPNIIINSGGKHITVNLRDIVYAEVFNRKIIIHTMSSDIEYYGKMKELAAVAGENFYRPHRGYLVNFGYIRKYDSSTIWLEKGQAIIAKQNYQDFVKCYLNYNRRKMRHGD